MTANRLRAGGLPLAAEHADQTLRRRASFGPELLEGDGSLDVVAQDGLARVHVARQQGLDAFLRQGVAEFRGAPDPGQDRFLSVACQCHGQRGTLLPAQGRKQHMVKALPMNPNRAAWGDQFPDVILLANESAVKQHPDYRAAKTGDAHAAVRLVRALVSDEAIDTLGRTLGERHPIVASIHAQEKDGINEIPEALAVRIAERLGLKTDTSLVQTNVVNHTGADGFSRLARQALFAGDVVEGAAYLIVDDFIGQGGTMANFRGHIVTNGGDVIGAVALTGKPYSAKLALLDQQLGELRDRHGELEDWWRKCFGFGFEALTQSEARYLARTADADTIRDRVAAAGQGEDGSDR